MFVLVTYDVNTITSDGKSRLRRIARLCCNHGQRVQNSVFECNLDAAQFRLLKHKLVEAFDPNVDSLRFYILGNNYKKKVEHYGAKPSFDVTEALIV